eukprot:TRINITY_DN4697_c0_g1_i7.p1 TRINITY_DN4697_c0_g1~~TRINITY_DN4697_c0_g1_i7.p1  ORF type:complete len:128 (+),score=18.82 TRINITY_DN4697_c0_g1_i7:651-1034(+)
MFSGINQIIFMFEFYHTKFNSISPSSNICKTNISCLTKVIFQILPTATWRYILYRASIVGIFGWTKTRGSPFPVPSITTSAISTSITSSITTTTTTTTPVLCVDTTASISLSPNISEEFWYFCWSEN